MMKKRILFAILLCILLPVFAGALEKGDQVCFGVYEQDNDTENGKEPIEWIVIDQDEESVELITVYGIDARQYHKKYEPVTWAGCSLRTWLNEDFLNAAFTEEEKSVLLRTVIVTDDNSTFHTLGGEQTEDFVFILSAGELKSLVTPAAKRQIRPTPYAIENNAYAMTRGKTKGNCWWWVRMPGNEQDTAAYVKDDGTIFYKGIDVDFFSVAIRPVIRISQDYFNQ